MTQPNDLCLTMDKKAILKIIPPFHNPTHPKVDEQKWRQGSTVPNCQEAKKIFVNNQATVSCIKLLIDKISIWYLIISFCFSYYVSNIWDIKQSFLTFSNDEHS